MTTIPHQLGPSTTAIHAGERVDPTTHALNTPLYQTATFAFDSAEEKEAAVDRSLEREPGVFFYTRTGNPTTAALRASSPPSKAPRTRPSARPAWRPCRRRCCRCSTPATTSSPRPTCS